MSYVNHQQAFHCVLPHVMVAGKFILNVLNSYTLFGVFLAQESPVLSLVSLMSTYPRSIFSLQKNDLVALTFFVVHPATYLKHCLVLLDVLSGSL